MHLGTGIAELPGVLALDMSSVDFSEISDLSKRYRSVSGDINQEETVDEADAQMMAE